MPLGAVSLLVNMPTCVEAFPIDAKSTSCVLTSLLLTAPGTLSSCGLMYVSDSSVIDFPIAGLGSVIFLACVVFNVMLGGGGLD